MSAGLSCAGIRVLGAIDNDPDCRETYEANHPDSKFIQADITEIRPDKLTAELGVEKNDDNLLFVGCSPCQYWSIINSDKSKSHKSRNLLHDFMRFVRHYRPGFVLVENVRGIKRNAKESGLEDMLHFFDNNGYKYDFDILVAAHYGVPQSRRRFVLIASRVAEIKIPRTGNEIAIVKDKIGEKAELPKIAAGESPPARDSLHRSSSLSEKNIERLKLTQEGDLRCNKSWAQGDLLIPAYKDKPDSYFKENYGRMAWDKPAPTITTKFFALSCGRFGHPEQNRAISLREGALLQTFPRHYKFKTKSIAATAKLIGNAVPPELARRIGKYLVEQARRGGHI